MQFKILDIAFDLDCDSAIEELTDEEAKALHEEYKGTVWEAWDEDDLIEEITCASGWCVEAIVFVNLLPKEW